MTTQAEFECRIEALNQPFINLENDNDPIVGWKSIAEFLEQIYTNQFQNKNRLGIIALDGYVGNDWKFIIGEIEAELEAQGYSVSFFNVESALKSQAEIDKILEPFLTDDPVFGRIYKKDLVTLFDKQKLASLKKEISGLKRKKQAAARELVVCYGAGAALSRLRKLYDSIFYIDLTRQEVLKRSKTWTQLAGKTQSISPKKLYYVDFQVNDRHRNRLLAKADFYIDGNVHESPKLISLSALRKITGALSTSPFRLKPMYEPGPWGGQWLKKIRNLPDDWVNCAWSFEVIAQEMSLLVSVQKEILELPWTTFFHFGYDSIMGDVPKRRFGGEFPIRYDYLDTMEGGDLSIQVHPPTPYIRENFNEPYHQGEMYYIVEAKEGTTVNLGVNDKTKKEEFHHAAKLADEKGIGFNYRDFVNSVPSKKHDLLMIPPGTVHGSGEGQVVLEISATTYRYTFKIYDHLRPDLNGIMRPIHVEHAFNVIKWFRRERWVAQNLVQEPQLVRSGRGWAEYLIGDRREFFHVVFRMEFDRKMEDDTDGKFHVLTLVEGESVKLASVSDSNIFFIFNYSETIIVPACLGKYRVENLGEKPCKIAKARLRK